MFNDHKRLEDEVITPIVADITARLVKTMSADASRPVYHYTTANALRQIIETGTLWAGSLSFSNDKREYEHGFAAICRGLKDAAKLTGTVGRVAGLTCDYLDVNDRAKTCSCCFSALPDDLEQWRGYGNGGFGYALGLDLRGVVATSQEQHVDMGHRFIWAVCKVIYDADIVLSAIVRPLIDGLAAHRILGADADIVAQYIAAGLVKYAPMFKHAAFAHEREFRLLTDVDDDADFRYRIRNDLFCPYVELRLASGKLPITRIVIGPCLQGDRASSGLKMFLSSHGYGDVEVVNSEVPYLP